MEGVREPLLHQESGGFIPRKAIAGETESLSYDPPTNKPRIQDHKEWQGRRHLYGYTGHTAVARISTIVSGMLIGIIAVALQTSIEQLVLLRNRTLQHFFSISLGQAVGMWVAISVSFVVASGTLVQLFAPKAAGAGVSLVMAFLNGVDIRGLLSIPVLIMKFVGLIGSRVAGLAVGPEGPMIHLGACVSSLVCACEPWVLSHVRRRSVTSHRNNRSPSRQGSGADLGQTPGLVDTRNRRESTEGNHGNIETDGEKPLAYIMKNADHREMVSAGVAAGIAAAFGAPIGGVLFSLEEAATHWSRKVGWRCFLCTTCATFTLAQLHPRSQSGMLSFKADTPLTNQQWLTQAPFVIMVSACGGLLGAAFNVLRKQLWPIRASRKKMGLRLAEAAGVAGITAALMALLALTVGRCMPIPDSWEEWQPVRMTCPKGYYNDLGTTFLGSDVFVIRTLLNLGSESLPVKESCDFWSPCYFSWPSLAALSACYLVLMALASSICMPGGLFMPSIMIGGSFGALFGFALRQLLPYSWNIQPGVYALLCATAVLGGVFRSTFSLVVIVVEGTRGIDFLFGIIIAILISNLVASRVLPDGVYESELERDGNVYYLRPEPPFPLRGKTAGDIMATPVIGVEAIVPVTCVHQLLARTTHNGFVVYSRAQLRDPATGMGRLDGFILRSQLEVLLRRQAYCDAAGEYFSPPEDLAAFEVAANQEMRRAQQTTVMEPDPAAAVRDGHLLSPQPSRNSSQQSEHWGLPFWRQQQLGGDHVMDGLHQHAPCVVVSGASAGASSADLKGREGLPPDETSMTPKGLLSPVGLSLEAAAAAAGLLDSPSRTEVSSHGLGGSRAGSELYLNLSPFMNRAPLVVRPQTLGTTVHHLFLAMSLRHLCVVDARNQVMGIITRKDLDHAAGEGWWRINKVAPQPHHGLKRSQSWLAISLAAPRRLLFSIHAALSPITSPFSSRRGTPKNSPTSTPRVCSPRASDLEGRTGFSLHHSSTDADNVDDSSRVSFLQSPSAWAEQGIAAEAAAAAAAGVARVMLREGSGFTGAEAVSIDVQEHIDEPGTGGGSSSSSNMGFRLSLGRISPGRPGKRSPAQPIDISGRNGKSARVDTAAAEVSQESPSPSLGAMATIEEHSVTAEDSGAEGPLQAPRWVRTLSKDLGLEAFGSVAFADEEVRRVAES